MNKPNRTHKLGVFSNFRVSYSTVNKYQNNSFYLALKSWVHPIINTHNYTPYLNYMKNKIKTIIHDNMDDVFYNNFILDFNVTYDSMEYNKKSFMNIEITFYPKHFISIDDEDLYDFFNFLANDITQQLNENSNFIFNVNKND